MIYWVYHNRKDKNNLCDSAENEFIVKSKLCFRRTYSVSKQVLYSNIN